MSSFWNFIFGAILVILWVIAGGYVTAANIKLSSYSDDDLDLHQAYWFTFWAAFVTWTLVGIFIILVILSVVGLVALFGSGVGEVGVAAEGAEGGVLASEELGSSQLSEQYLKSQEQSGISQGISWLTLAFLIFALILVGITGILAAIAASSMVKSSNFKNTDAKLTTAYTDCIIAASMCLGAGGILIIGTITYFIVGYIREGKIKAQQAIIEKQKKLEISEIQQLQQQSAVQKLQEQSSFQKQLQDAAQKAILQKINAQLSGPAKAVG